MNTIEALKTVSMFEPTRKPSLFDHSEWPSIPRKESLQEDLYSEVNQHSNITTHTRAVDKHGSILLNLKPIPQIIAPTLQSYPKTNFKALQKWEGFVINVFKNSFTARLKPIGIVSEGPEQEAKINMNEIDEEDQTLVEPGAVFYWSIGYLNSPSGRTRASLIRFRRLPAWTHHDLKVAEEEASKLKGLF